MEKPLTILNMSLHQGVEQAMNAGLDAAIGDFVFEFDSLDTPYPPSWSGRPTRRPSPVLTW